MRSKLPIFTTSIISLALIWYISLKLVSSKQACTGMAPDNAPGPKFPVGIGFDLTAFYGTVAIAYSDGSVIDVGRVEANPQYHEVLKRLSLSSSDHLHPPYAEFDEFYVDAPRRVLRSLRKAIGLPASGDVAALSTMAQNLKCKATAFLGSEINHVPIVAVTPTLIALYEEDVVDAFEYAGLQLASIYRSGKFVPETCAAYAGYGHGLCSEYTDPEKCKSELRNVPSEEVLSVLYTRGGLRTICTTMHSAYWMFLLQLRWTADWDLGFDPRNKNDYWKRVSNALQTWKQGLPGTGGPAKVLLLGDSAGDETFRSVLNESLLATVGKIPPIFFEGSEFIAARGAAEFARRSIYMTEDGGSPMQEMELR